MKRQNMRYSRARHIEWVRHVARSVAFFRRGWRDGANLLEAALGGDEGSRASLGEHGELQEIFESHAVGPGIWKWRHYFEVYERHLARFRGQEVHLLEIGVFSGGSLMMWRKYFGAGLSLYGVDIEEACKAYEDARTHIFIGDQAEPAFWERTLQEIPQLDIVIDDGGHEAIQQVTTLRATLPKLRPGGVYICEDIHGMGNHFQSYIDGLARSLHGSNAVADGLEHDSTSFQAAVDSVHIYPFMVVIERRPAPLVKLSAPRHGTEWQPFLGEGFLGPRV